jgi:hypothetical protein
MKDPTLEEMREYLGASPYASEMDEFDREEAIYWFANDWHGGQWSNLYSALSQSQYHPGPLTNGPEPGSMSSYLYGDLEHEFTDKEVQS